MSGHNRIRDDDADDNCRRVCGDVHKRAVEGDSLLGFLEVAEDPVGDLSEFLFHVVFAVEGFDDADAVDVLINCLVQIVIGIEDFDEDRVGFVGDKYQNEACDRNEDKENESGLPICDETHDKGEDHQERSADDRSADHLESALNVCDVRGGSSDKGAGREFVDVLERVILNMDEQGFTEVLSKASCRTSSKDASDNAGCRCKDGHASDNAGIHEYGIKVLWIDGKVFNLVDEELHEISNKTFGDALKKNTDPSKDRVFPVAFDVAK